MELHCFCNLPSCSSSVCESRVGCFRELEGAGAGCLELFPDPVCVPTLQARFARDTKTFLSCCRTSMCNYRPEEPSSPSPICERTGWEWLFGVSVVGVPILGIILLLLLVVLGLSLLNRHKPDKPRLLSSDPL